MGFDITHRLRLEFDEDSALHGSTVILRGELPLREFLAVQRASAALRDAEEGESDAALVELHRVFGDTVLLEWDLFDGETAIPASGEGMLAIPMRAANAILTAWNEAQGVSPNLNAVSASGASEAAA